MSNLKKNQNALLTGIIYGAPLGIATATQASTFKGMATAAVAVPVMTSALALISSTQQKQTTIQEATKEGAVVGTVAGSALAAGVVGLSLLASSLNDPPQNSTYPPAYVALYKEGISKEKALKMGAFVAAGTVGGAVLGTLLGVTQGAISGNDTQDE